MVRIESYSRPGISHDSYNTLGCPKKGIPCTTPLIGALARLGQAITSTNLPQEEQ